MSSHVTPPKGRLFPLNLTPFEHYMLWDDYPSHPKVFVVQYVFSGELDRAAFESAFRDALVRHPLLTAIVRPVKSNRDCWVDARDQPPTIDWGDLNDPIEMEREFIDLRREVGLRCWVRHDRERAVVTTQFHHSVCDGIGSYQFIGDVLWYYAHHSGKPESGDLPVIDVTGLRRRLRATYKFEDYFDDHGTLREEWKADSNVLIPTTTALAEAKDSTHEPVPFPGIVSQTMSVEDYRRLRLFAQDRGQTPNDLLLEKLFLAMYAWNRANGQSEFDSMGVLTPMDLRSSEETLVPAANYVTTEFFHCGRELLESPERLPDHIRAEMTQLKHHRHRSRFMGMVSSAMEVSGDMKEMLAADHCWATAVFSNTGDPTRRFHYRFDRQRGAICVAGLILEDVGGVPPLRPGTHLTVSVFTYRRQLKVCFRGDPHRFTCADTQKLLDGYMARIRADVFGEVPPDSPGPPPIAPG